MSEEPSLITVRALEPADAPAVAQLMGMDGVYPALMQLPYSAIASRVEFLTKPEPLGCRLVAEAEGRIVGSAGLHPVGPSLRRSHVRLMGISVATDWQGRGVGTQLMAAVVDWADNWANVLRLELHVYADNARAIRLYQRFGFVQEGLHRGYALRGGQYVDSLSMARHHPNPPRLP